MANGMHVHISWATVLVTFLSFVAVIGTANLVARNGGGTPSRVWKLVASPN